MRPVTWPPPAANPSQTETREIAAVEDAPVAAIKIGALFSPAAVRAVAQCLARKPNVPVVWDPVLAPTRGEPFADDETRCRAPPS